MSTNTELAEVAGKLLFAIIFGFVIRPLAIIWGLNVVLGAIGISQLPYTLMVYLGVLVIILAIKAEVREQ